MVAEIPGMGDAGRVYTGIYRRYGKYPVYTGIFGVLRPLYCLPAPRRATARRAGPSAARTWRRSSHAPVGLLLFTGARDGGVGRRRRTRCPRAARARGAARLRLAAADSEPGSRGVPVYGSDGRPKAKYPVWGNGPGYIPVYTGILPYRYIPSEIPEPPYFAPRAGLRAYSPLQRRRSPKRPGVCAPRAFTPPHSSGRSSSSQGWRNGAPRCASRGHLQPAHA